VDVAAPYEIRALAVLEGHRWSEVSPEAVREMLDSATTAQWVQIEFRDRLATRKMMMEVLGLHELAVEDSLSHDERPSMSDFDGTLFLVATAPHNDAFEEIAFFAKGNCLITVAEHRVDCIEALSNHSLGKHRTEALGMLFHTLIDGIVDAYFPLIDDLEDAVDDVADEIYNGSLTKVRDLLMLKRRFRSVRRAVVPLRDVLNQLLRHEHPILTEEVKRYFQDVYDHCLRLSDLIDSNRETLASMLDVHLSNVSNNLNEIVKKMTVISTVLMVGALIAGIYGMNFKSMPELDWQYGYPMAIGLMVVGGLLVIWIFKRKRWL
jgi:magnesium transporter